MIRLFHTKIGFYRIYPSGFYVDPISKYSFGVPYYGSPVKYGECCKAVFISHQKAYFCMELYIRMCRVIYVYVQSYAYICDILMPKKYFLKDQELFKKEDDLFKK